MQFSAEFNFHVILEYTCKLEERNNNKERKTKESKQWNSNKGIKAPLLSRSIWLLTVQFPYLYYDRNIAAKRIKLLPSSIFTLFRKTLVNEYSRTLMKLHLFDTRIVVSNKRDVWYSWKHVWLSTVWLPCVCYNLTDMLLLITSSDFYILSQN